jgi:aerobic-type carbon monoxide dehydrogenase small subunit (CoxS/CutS family)
MSSAENEAMADRRLSRTIAVTVNGRVYERRVSTRKNLADFLREDIGLTGTHVGCEHGVCGACSLFVDGVLLRSCLMLAVQCDGAEIRTIEGLGQHELHARATGVLEPPCLAMRLLHSGNDSYRY